MRLVKAAKAPPHAKFYSLGTAYSRLKNSSAAVNTTRSATRILLRGWGLEPRVKSFAQKLSNLAPVSNKLMQLMRITQ